MPRYLIGVGSNLGNRQEMIENAVAKLRPHVFELKQSRWMTYPAIGGLSAQEDFLNGVLSVRSHLGPDELAGLLHELEDQAGRTRMERWGSRPLDMDLLLADRRQIYTPQLTVPHPRMMTRRFVLEPAADVAAEMVHPEIGWTMERLCQHLSAPPWFFVVGSQSDLVSSVAAAMAHDSEGTAVRLNAREEMVAALEWGERVRERVVPVIRDTRFPAHPVISFSAGYGGLQASDLEVDGIRPKLMLVCDPRGSKFSRDLLSSGWQIPTVFLSADREHALQDAVGAVHAMR